MGKMKDLESWKVKQSIYKDNNQRTNLVRGQGGGPPTELTATTDFIHNTCDCIHVIVPNAEITGGGGGSFSPILRTQ